eukprot:gnl/Chilomastix_cuspidata/2467.p1 GENE.gnl/Chilomastix_cuspidata/2467~~gnl/Chilomastix_cuspidata/2467.p1  ORF type:complete len:357 (+),score=106.80 gnl/Chilomastix_cuspidata/2467:49-1119(+)
MEEHGPETAEGSSAHSPSCELLKQVVLLRGFSIQANPSGEYIVTTIQEDRKQYRRAVAQFKLLTPPQIPYIQIRILGDGQGGPQEPIIGVGFAVDYSRHLYDGMVGWNPRTIGYHADDGGLFVEKGSPFCRLPPASGGDELGMAMLPAPHAQVVLTRARTVVGTISLRYLSNSLCAPGFALLPSVSAAMPNTPIRAAVRVGDAAAAPAVSRLFARLAAPSAAALRLGQLSEAAFDSLRALREAARAAAKEDPLAPLLDATFALQSARAALEHAAGAERARVAADVAMLRRALEHLARIAEEELQRRESNMCSVCWAFDANTVLLPCRHVTVCATCAEKLQKCPLCRQPMESFRVIQ